MHALTDLWKSDQTQSDPWNIDDKIYGSPHLSFPPIKHNYGYQHESISGGSSTLPLEHAPLFLTGPDCVGVILCGVRSKKANDDCATALSMHEISTD